MGESQDKKTIRWMREEIRKVTDEINEWQSEKDIRKAVYDGLQEIKRKISYIGSDPQYD